MIQITRDIPMEKMQVVPKHLILKDVDDASLIAVLKENRQAMIDERSSFYGTVVTENKFDGQFRL